ncbi:MAG: hypothetical protein IPQ07_36525 [Myxococcales bacterium]|nr:hypothetical protein [Myxococcales bacterium]
MRENASRRTSRIAQMFISLALLAPAAANAGRKVVVLRAEGKVDAFARKQLEYKLLELARRVDPKATQVDFSFPDAAAVSNCTGDLDKCNAAVLDEFGVDELLVATAEPMPDGSVSVTVRRASKAKPIQTITFSARGDALGTETTTRIGPWYGVTATGAPSEPGSALTTEPPAPVAGEPSPAAPAVPGPQDSPPPSAPSDEWNGHGTGRAYLGGVIGGGVLAAVGVVLWTRARSTQSEIDAAASSTAADLHHLQDLESSGRSYALWGNVTVIAGVALAATCGYFYWRARGKHTRTVAISPSLHPHGGGLTLTIGGLP